MHILNVKVPLELHKRFRKACFYDRKVMSELVRAWIERYVVRIERKQKQK